ncbi:MAG: hypothetical protein IJU93_04070 [Lachnospiraceae bacterium]|nr:hypothetical protein [Lachnospiraceae bacterium]
MTLLITVLAAVIATAVWYTKNDNSMNMGMLCFLFWGASIMWMADAIFEYAELGAEYFSPSPQDMLNDTFLGLAVIALALVIWIVALLIKDPKGKVLMTLKKQARV